LIAEDQHRCHRCGRRLQDAPGAYPVGNSALAPKLEPVPAGDVEEPVRPAATGPLRQVPLFDDRPKIIPFESLTRRKVSARRQTVARREAQAVSVAVAAERAAQQPLDLRAPAPRHKSAVTEDIPVAVTGARLEAAVVDALLLSGGIAAAATTFYLMGGRVALSTGSLVPCGVAAAAVAVFYHLFFSVLGAESAGMRSMGLRTLTFDGHEPTWHQRVARFVLSLFSVGAVGIGVLWALIDDEGLTWHDHITGTYPTEYDPNPSSLRRR
jgi:uncharacterized RDD family membrane protein YckC